MCGQLLNEPVWMLLHLKMLGKFSTCKFAYSFFFFLRQCKFLVFRSPVAYCFSSMAYGVKKIISFCLSHCLGSFI